MASDIVVPTLGESVSEATVAQWLKKPGEAVAQDEPLVELETDKVTLEVNASAAGVLSEILAQEGDNVEVGAILGRIGEGEGSQPAPAEARSEPAKQEAPKEEAPKEEAKKPEPEPEAASAPARSNGAGNSGGEGEPVEVVVPTLGESVSEATVAQWMKQPGDAVAADEPLLELETDKVTLEVNAPAAGVLREIKAESGATVEVGAILGIVAAGASAGAAEASKPPKPVPPAEEEPKPAPQPPSPDPVSQPARQAPVSAASAVEPVGGAQMLEGLDPSRAPHSKGGKIGRDDLLAFLGVGGGGAPAAASNGAGTGGAAHDALSPAVRKMVADNNLDPSAIPGSGKDGRITKEDVQSYMKGGGKPAPSPAPSSATSSGPPQAPAPSSAKAPSAKAPADGAREERVPMSRLRRTIADRLKEAQNTAAILTTFNECDMGAVMELRGRYKESFEKKHGVKLGFTSFFTKAVVGALKDVPSVNAQIDGTDIVYKHYYDIGMAVSTPNGLMVPVVRDCEGKSFAEIEQSLGDLAKRGRDGKLSMEEMQGGTFTITNGGVFGSLLSTPILNRPQSAILGLHKIQERPMAVDGKVEVRPMMYLALSYDHRIIDGREAVTFLVRVKENIEDPERLLIGM